METSAETGIFFSVVSDENKKALLNIISNSMTIDEIKGTCCVNKVTLEVTSS